MKKKLLILLACLLCLVLCGCLTAEPQDSETTGEATLGIQAPPTDTAAPTTEPTVTDPSIPSTEAPPHQHSWCDATCTDPQTCTQCGATQGKPLGHHWQDATCTHAKTCPNCGATEGSKGNHTWKDATCTDPKTCTECGKTQGKPIGHDYADGSCIHCGTKAPSGEAMVWIPTNGGSKYHSRSGCSNMKDPKQVPKSEAEALGFTPCKRCH